MKKETQHPVDTFFREQEANIPVSFDAAHWDALQAMLDQSAAGNVGMPVSDQAANSTRPSLIRLFSAMLIFVFLVGIPSEYPAASQRMETQERDLSFSKEFTPEYPAVPDEQKVADKPKVQQDRRQTSTSAVQEGKLQLSPEWTAVTSREGKVKKQVAAVEVDTMQHLSPTVTPFLKVLSSQTDSLILRKGLQPARDSTAEKQKKKRKHLFW